MTVKLFLFKPFTTNPPLKDLDVIASVQMQKNITTVGLRENKDFYWFQ